MKQIKRSISFELLIVLTLSFDLLYGGNLMQANIKLHELRCEYAINPLGIDVRTPKFSWILESLERGQMQGAYQILVATSLENLHRDIGDKWNSKKIKLPNSVNIPYEGNLLSSGEKCFWKVRVWDKKGEVSDWSEIATFEMGLLSESDWGANGLEPAFSTICLILKGSLGRLSH